jgi:transporter family-2 protein
LAPGSPLTLLLVIAAAAGLVVQNALMTRIAAGGPALAALLANSAVGLVLIAGLGCWLYGPGFPAETLRHFRPYWLLPGMLGTFFVFASVTGYRDLGAAPTTAALVASQLCCGLLADGFGLTGPGREVGASQWLGALLLVAGALLTVQHRS